MGSVVEPGGGQPRLVLGRVVLVVVERQDGLPVLAQLLVALEPAGADPVDGPLWNHPTVGVAGPLDRQVVERGVRRGVPQHQRGDPVRVGDGVLQGDEPAVRAASHDNLLVAEVLPDGIHIGHPLLVRERLVVAGLAGSAGVEDDDPHPVGERAERTFRFVARAETGRPMVHDHRRCVGRAERLDDQFSAVDFHRTPR